MRELMLNSVKTMATLTCNFDQNWPRWRGFKISGTLISDIEWLSLSDTDLLYAYSQLVIQYNKALY